MGQNNSRQSETINWNQIKTNEMSSTIPNMDGISVEARELISRLNLPEISESNTEFDISNVFSNEVINNNNIEKQATEFDATSPFISSEMYNYLVNKHNNGTNNNNNINNNINMLGGGKIDEDSETSATSSSLSSSDLESSPSETDEKHVKKEKKHNKKEHDKKEKEVVGESVQMETENHEGWGKKKNNKSKKNIKNKSNKISYTGTEDYLSYVSSSAHTGGSLTESVANENNYTISTVNTSDINMISE